MPRIDKLWAFIAPDTGPEDEGLVTAMASDPLIGNFPMPLIGGDMDRLESTRPVAQKIANASGVTIKLVTFSVRTEVEEIVPQ